MARLPETLFIVDQKKLNATLQSIEDINKRADQRNRELHEKISTDVKQVIGGVATAVSIGYVVTASEDEEACNRLGNMALGGSILAAAAPGFTASLLTANGAAAAASIVLTTGAAPMVAIGVGIWATCRLTSWGISKLRPR